MRLRLVRKLAKLGSLLNGGPKILYFSLTFRILMLTKTQKGERIFMIGLQQ